MHFLETCLIPEMSAIFLLKPVCTWPLAGGNANRRKTTLFGKINTDVQEF